MDTCGGISAQKAGNGMVVLCLPKMEEGLVVMKAGVSLFLDNENIEINRTELKLWLTAKCVMVLKQLPMSGRESETPTEHHYLDVKVLDDMSVTVWISHIIALR